MTPDQHARQVAPHAPSDTSTDPTAPETLEVSHAEFRRGLPAGEFQLIVNPAKARPYIRQRLFLVPLMLPVMGVGVALALSGHPWIGLGLILAGGFVYRLIKLQAPNILLHLALKDPRTYADAIEYEILEVRRKSG